MVQEIVAYLLVLILFVYCLLIHRHVEVLTDAVAKLVAGHAEHTKWSAQMAKDLAEQIDKTNERVDGIKEKVDDLPVEKFREIADQEASFVDGLNNILNYSLKNYGLNKDGAKHE